MSATYCFLCLLGLSFRFWLPLFCLLFLLLRFLRFRQLFVVGFLFMQQALYHQARKFSASSKVQVPVVLRSHGWFCFRQFYHAVFSAHGFILVPEGNAGAFSNEALGISHGGYGFPGFELTADV